MTDDLTDDDLAEKVLAALYDVAPEAEGEELEPKVNLRDQLDIDSVDFLNFVIALHKATGVEIPEADYPKLTTLDGAVAYLKEKA